MTELLRSPSLFLLLLLLLGTLLAGRGARGMPTFQPTDQEDDDPTVVLDPADNDDVDETSPQDELSFTGNDTLAELENNGTASVNDTDIVNQQIIKSVRDQDKERRLEMIRAHILNTTGRTERPQGVNGSNPSTAFKDLMGILKSMGPWSSVDGYTEKVQSFYPVCKAVEHVDEREGMHLHFDLTYPTPLEGSALSILAAKLKLYKVSQGNQSNSLPGTVAACAPRRTVDPSVALEAAATVAAGNGLSLPNLPLAPAVPTEPYVEDDRRVRVSVYYNLPRSSKRNRTRRKLLDTKMLAVSGDEWVELNVRAAARSWRNSSRNMGLVVEVEDEEGKPLPAARFFNDMNCSKEASTSRPIPSFLLDAARERNGHQNASLQFSPDLFPVIDLCTMDLPKSEKKPLVTSVPVGVPVHSEMHVKHGSGFGSEVTSVILLPYDKVAELARKQNETPVEDDETLEGNKNTSESRQQPQQEEETVIPEQQHQHETLIGDAPELTASQNEQPALHPHRHHRHQNAHHRTHSHEEASEWHHNPHLDESSDSHEDELSTDDEWSWHRKHPHPHRLHHRYHHHGHRFHASSSMGSGDDWSEESRRLIVVPASELLALSEHLEREEERVQRQLAAGVIVHQRKDGELER